MLVDCNKRITIHVNRWGGDYESILYPTLQAWEDLHGQFSGGPLVSQETLQHLADSCTKGSRWNKGAKPGGIKNDRGIGVQLKAQFGKLPHPVQMEITRCRERMTRAQGSNFPEDTSAITINGLRCEYGITARFYRADLGVREECKEMVEKHKGEVTAFLIHLTDEDKVDKAQFSICMGVIRDMGKENAYVVQVTIFAFY
jgi:hypothetical protein